MYIKSLYLERFRNYREAYFEFSPSLNFICGPNGQGKTSLLEAIHYLMFGRSFRPGLHQDLIHLGCHSFYLESIFCKYDVDQKLRVYNEGKERKFVYNHTTLQSISNLLGIIQGVVMTPDDVNLVKGAPAVRRQFLDMQLAQADPLYVHHLTRYVKAMRHRNQLLKEKKLTTIESWEHEMAQSATYIVLKRRLCLLSIQTHCQSFYCYLTGEEKSLSLDYLSGSPLYQNEGELKAFYLKLFNKNRNRELIFGNTLAGPHKDDIRISIGNRDVRYFASEGEQRSCVAALHMGEWQSLKQLAEDIPLFMIDDVSMSLDDKRKSRLLDQLVSLGQVFLTTTEMELAQAYTGQKKIFTLPLDTHVTHK
ncbi:MAG: DNA replication/repair protein RecF [Parachlamydiaceae bacterium]